MDEPGGLGGAQNRTPDTSASDYYNVTVTHVGASQQYKVCSEGHLVDAGGERMVRTVAGDFQVYYGFGNAVAAGADLFLPAGVTVTGNVYAVLSLTNLGTIDGCAWITRTSVANSGTITGLTTVNAATQALGNYPTGEPIMYWSGGMPYSAPLILNDSNTDQTWQSDTSNPMGVWYRQGGLHLSGKTTINGTLIVANDLYLCANSITTITPKPGFPALVVKGNLILENDASATTINGTTIVHNLIKTSGTVPNARLTINGAVLFPYPYSGFDSAFAAAAKVAINYDPSAVDVSGFYPAQPRVLAGGVMYAYHADGL